MAILQRNKILITLIALILFFSYLASLILTSFGSVEVKTLRLDTQNNQYLIYDLYKPKIASKENKAPFIAIIPGFQRSKEALSNIAILRGGVNKKLLLLNVLLIILNFNSLFYTNIFQDYLLTHY